MKNIVVDFESNYDTKNNIGAAQLSNANYYAKSDAYMLSIVSEDGCWCGHIDECRTTFGEGFWTDPTHRFWAAHANFDMGWAEKYFPKTASPWECILDVAAFHQMPRNLAGLSKVLLGQKLDKSTRDEMDGVDYWALPKERQHQVLEYCLQDSMTEHEALMKMGPDSMSPAEKQIAAHTRAINRRGIHVNLELVEADKTRLEELKHRSFMALPWRNTDKPLSNAAMGRWCASQGIDCPASLAKTDDECNDLMSSDPRFNEVMSHLRMFRRANTLITKAESIMARTTDDGTMPLDFLYCGAAHTRRWSSRGVNLQNLDKTPIPIGDGTDVWSRRWIVPPPGKIFFCADYSQIEPRCLAWLTGNDELLDAVRQGYKIYEAYAKAVKGWKGTPGTMADTDPKFYAQVKAEFLGLGYGMGASKFVEQNPGLGLSEVQAKTVVDGFRRDNAKTPAFWKQMDAHIRTAAMSKDKTLSIEMPSGDLLKHFDVKAFADFMPDGRRKTGYRSITTKGEYSRTSIQNSLWGGTLTENVTQRMARDVMANAMLNLDEAGFEIAFTVHDEIITALDIPTKDADRKEVERILKQAPEWAPDLPLGIGGGFAEHYKKL